MLMDIVSSLNLDVLAVKEEEYFTNKLLSTK